MLPAELFRKVRKIEIKTRRIVDEITGGAYRSVFKGRGIEFDEVREYTVNDDVRDIDWNVTARMGAPYIKKYVEERELTVIMAVDASASGAFGSGNAAKRDQAIEIAALLAFSAIRNQDRVGLLIFTDRTELYLPPRSGRGNGLRLIRELLAFHPTGTGTDINVALKDLIQAQKKKAVIFLISDLIADAGFEKTLKIANKRHDVIAARILDPLELHWPRSAGLMLEDAENGNTAFFPGRETAALAAYADAAGSYHQAVAETCRRAKVDMIDLRCGEDYVKPLIRFFKQRQGKR
ncbi:MAG: DUF58 domain-containing protein [Victivallales bacterium]|nr:DUF58 domain-containing protein [Victivallales bacterium]